MRKLYILIFLLAMPFWLLAQGTPLDRTAWTVTYTDSQQSAGESGANTIDGNTGTFWHTPWSPTLEPPHSIEIDMGSPDKIYCYGFIPRSGDNGRPKDCIVSVKLNPGDPWTEVARGTTVSSDNQQNFYFSPVDAQYLKLEVLNNWSNLNHTVIAEIYAYNPPEIDFAASKTQVYTGETTKFKGFTSLDTPTLAWVFNGGTPATANTGEVDVVYNTYGKYDVTLTINDGSSPAPLTKTNYITVTDTLIPRYEWKNAGYSSITSTAGYEVEKVFDGNSGTFFYTPFAAPFPAFPHYYTVDMGKVNPVTALGYTPRATGANGLIKGFEFWVSLDNATWTKVSEGTWAKNNDAKIEMLASKVDARYFKLVMLSNYQTDPADTRCQIAELNAFGPVKIVDFTSEITVMDVKFHAKANGTPTGYAWTFENGTPATSTSQNPMVSFTVSGSNTVTCTATYAGGETTSVTKEVVVIPFEIPPTNWSVVEVVDEEPAEAPNGYATNLFDNDLETFWHTQWANQYTPFPHWITVDMGRPYNLSAISFDQRSSGTGRPQDIVILTSLDGVIFDTTAKATWANDAAQKVVFFDNVETQFYTFLIKSGYSAGTEPFSCGSELKAYGQNVVIYWSNPADISIGTALSETQLNATSNFPGTYIYNPPLGTKLGLGTHELTVDFTPTDITLAPVTQTVSINVTRPLIPTTDWTVHFVDSYEFTSEMANAELTFDGDLSTLWHTQYDTIATEYPHQLIINMGKVYPLGMLSIDLRDHGNGRIKDYEIWTSLTGGMNLADSSIIASEWQMVAKGTWEGEDGGFKDVVCTTGDAQYFRILALNEVYDQPFAAILEIKAYESVNTTGIKNKVSSSLSVYPNPARETLNIVNLSDVTKSKNVTVSVSDFNGKTVLTGKLVSNSNSAELNVSMLPKGMYMLKVQTESGTSFTKFVKQ